MTKSMPLNPALAEYIGLWRDCRGRVLKSYSALVLKLEAAVVGVRDRLGAVMLVKLVVLLREQRGRCGFSSWPSLLSVEVDWWN